MAWTSLSAALDVNHVLDSLLHYCNPELIHNFCFFLTVVLATVRKNKICVFILLYRFKHKTEYPPITNAPPRVSSSALVLKTQECCNSYINSAPNYFVHTRNNSPIASSNVFVIIVSNYYGSVLFSSLVIYQSQ